MSGADKLREQAIFSIGLLKAPTSRYLSRRDRDLVVQTINELMSAWKLAERPPEQEKVSACQADERTAEENQLNLEASIPNWKRSHFNHAPDRITTEMDHCAPHVSDTVQVDAWSFVVGFYSYDDLQSLYSKPECHPDIYHEDGGIAMHWPSIGAIVEFEASGEVGASLVRLPSKSEQLIIPKQNRTNTVNQLLSFISPQLLQHGAAVLDKLRVQASKSPAIKHF
ncbi:hypothetical protein CAOG_00403 [Capsaspora owczarzaki ATCC 30864]|uniref:Uncharacterized protein n=1 Tax=Capsaspora owczarzaki (strain ATCC 30864) TaxID=595528 RepID=A0A0D2WIG3_CAPO3|nr:hypothetical protein CAOG_00403 [Capsaspora owczarzaki ATCC 30864]KJE88823.1 hypothetical protein CAOG_000403 [Capsaspora owczarzaki ATCC 30864]|eukprot:XP_004365274.1 hypothetical protein CAOG_00403 [Capsaspora owczarzaki ATCC 30864]